MDFYRQAEQILTQINNRKGSVKSLTLGNKTLDIGKAKRLYAIVIETQKRKVYVNIYFILVFLFFF